ncbi:hypothetical protein AK812_SmicGene14511 [Symbiodinium microadriaticum]|uniref:Uncharacterized protein n=1 Tax=Symbiodinium microadriaticum TaxID=2951 RepID=A0A1Q9E5E9_SYMMI|nr:hypothetical protein AK812_SmicGene14511 [Symbiodinium microadriaticum]
MSRETEGESTEAVPNFLEKLDESQRNEAVGRLLKLENEDTWNELLHRFACTRGVARQVTFRSLTGEAVELKLPPQHTLFHAKQALLDNVSKKMPALEVGYRRDARFFAGSEVLGEKMFVAMLPDEVSVVFDQVKKKLFDEFSSDESIGSSLGGGLFGSDDDD